MLFWAMLRRNNRQSEYECRSRPQFTLRTNMPAMRVNDVFYNRQPKPSSTSLARSRLVNAVEPFEYAVKMLRSDARAKILHVKLNLSRHCPRTHFDTLAQLSIL